MWKAEEDAPDQGQRCHKDGAPIRSKGPRWLLGALSPGGLRAPRLLFPGGRGGCGPLLMRGGRSAGGWSAPLFCFVPVMRVPGVGSLREEGRVFPWERFALVSILGLREVPSFPGGRLGLADSGGSMGGKLLIWFRITLWVVSDMLGGARP